MEVLFQKTYFWWNIMRAGCTDMRKYTEKWLKVSCYSIYQALFSGPTVDAYLGIDFSTGVIEDCSSCLWVVYCAMYSCLATGQNILTQSYNPKPISCPYKTINTRCANFVQRAIRETSVVNNVPNRPQLNGENFSDPKQQTIHPNALRNRASVWEDHLSR